MSHHITVGAGVAGLASIGTARSMGAVVSAYDVRPVVREQVRDVVDREEEEWERECGVVQCVVSS